MFVIVVFMFIFMFGFVWYASFRCKFACSVLCVVFSCCGVFGFVLLCLVLLVSVV